MCFKKNFAVSICKAITIRTLVIAVTSQIIMSPAQAEIVFSDGSTQSGQIMIDASQGITNGANLLHTFDTFNIQTTESATFTGPDVIDHVIARINGSGASTIDGLLKSSIVTADLYLINPNGIMWGENAQIDVDGGLFVSTANILGFADGSQLLISDSGASGFTAAAPSDFGFDVAPADIVFTKTTIESPMISPDVFGPPPVSGLNVSGGDISFDQSRIFLNGGDISVVSLGGAANIPINGAIPASTLAGFTGGDITIKGDPSELSDRVELESSGDPSGAVRITGNNLMLTKQAFLFADSKGISKGGGVELNLSGNLVMSGGSRITTDASGAGGGSNLTINAANISLEGLETRIASDNGSAQGRGGILTLTAETVTIADEARVGLSTLNQGDAGEANITVTDLTISGGAAITGETLGSGNGGAININATGSVIVDGAGPFRESFIISSTTFDVGNAGDISINAGTLIVTNTASIRSQSIFAGAPGTININGDQVNMASLGNISTSNRSTFADGGSINITAKSISLQDADADIPESTFTGITSSSLNSADGGAIVLVADTITVSDGAAIEALAVSEGNAGSISIEGQVTLDAARIDTTTGTLGGGGNAGAITIAGAGLSVNGGSITSSTSAAGDAGQIQLAASDQTLSNGAVITTSTSAGGNAGVITIAGASTVVTGVGTTVSSLTSGSGQAGEILSTGSNLTVNNGARIDTSTTSIAANAGNAGRIEFSGSTLIVTGASSTLASATSGPGSAGNVIVNATDVTVSDGGSIDTSTALTGPAGSINITASTVLVSGINAEVSGSTAGDATGGSVNIAATDLAINSGGTVSVTASGTGNAGNIELSASHHLDVLDGGNIETNAALSGGGNIIVDVLDRIYLRDSTLTASSGGQTVGDDGGNVTIDPVFLILDNSRIVAQAVQGNGGIINLFADNFISDVRSEISATSELGNDGEVTITSPDNSVTGVIGTLDASFNSDQVLLSEPCAARVLENRSSLVVVSGGKVESTPDDYTSEAVVGCRQN